MSAGGSSKIWTVLSLVSALLAAALAKKALDAGWKLSTGKEPPENPAHPDTSMGEAIAWATASGVAIGVARMLAQRKAADYYTKSTGHLPPDLQDDRDV